MRFFCPLDGIYNYRYIWLSKFEFLIINQRIIVIGVIVKSNEPFERALKRFTKSCEKNGIISDVKKRQRFEKPSEEKKRIETAARRKRLKEIADQNRKRLY
ncbi:ribosomal protein S21 [Fibrobacter sp. UWR4]|nr:ribosomal protein S21 [Fibrobacter sp. UWR4]PZW69085.1 ribosomal protein S21 [Fibrobacter sp. UWR1]